MSREWQRKGGSAVYSLYLPVWISVFRKLSGTVSLLHSLWIAAQSGLVKRDTAAGDQRRSAVSRGERTLWSAAIIGQRGSKPENRAISKRRQTRAKLYD